METTIMWKGYVLGSYRDYGKENGNYHNMEGYILESFRDNGKENGNYHNVEGLCTGVI